MAVRAAKLIQIAVVVVAFAVFQADAGKHLARGTQVEPLPSEPLSEGELGRRESLRRKGFAELHKEFQPPESDPVEVAQEKVLLLFDLDDTLAPMGQEVAPSMQELLRKLHEDGRYELSLLSTTAYQNAERQLGSTASYLDYILVENGLVSLKNVAEPGAEEWKFESVEENSIRNLNTAALREVDTAALEYIKDLFGIKEDGHPAGEDQGKMKDLWEKFGETLFNTEDPKISQQVTYKSAMLNYSPIGANIPVARDGYSEIRTEFKKRRDSKELLAHFMEYLQSQFGETNFASSDSGSRLSFNIGGSTGVDAFPEGWTKEYGLNFFLNRARQGRPVEKVADSQRFPAFKTFIFFGDKAEEPTGNDYHVCILANELCKVKWMGMECCQKVTGPSDTAELIERLLGDGANNAPTGGRA